MLIIKEHKCKGVVFMENYSILSNETVFADRAEKDIVFTVTLPEYQPNCVKVLRCETVPVVTEKYFSDGELVVNGKLNTSLLYISDYGNKLKSVTDSEDFSHSFKCKRELDGENATVNIVADILNSNASISSPRRLDVKSRLSLSAACTSGKTKNLYNPEEHFEDCVCVKTEQCAVCDEKYAVPCSDTLQTDINLESGESSIAEILYTSADGVIENTKCGDGTVDYSGYVDIHCIYEAETPDGEENPKAEYVTLSRRVPFEGSLESESVSQNSKAVLEMSVCGCEAGISYDPYGENRIVSVSVQYIVSGMMYDCGAVTLCTDAFGTKCECDVKVTSQNTERIVGFVNTKSTVNERVHTELRQIADITDSFSKIRVTGTEYADGKYFANAKVSITLFGKDSDGALGCADFSFNTRVPIEGAEYVPDSVFELCPHVQKTLLSTDNGALVCSADISLSGAQLERIKINAVESVVPDSTKKAGDGKAQIVVYYPDTGETLWNVAKHYRVNPELLKKINKLSNDVISDKKIIVIPKS